MVQPRSRSIDTGPHLEAMKVKNLFTFLKLHFSGLKIVFFFVLLNPATKCEYESDFPSNRPKSKRWNLTMDCWTLQKRTQETGVLLYYWNLKGPSSHMGITLN